MTVPGHATIGVVDVRLTAADAQFYWMSAKIGSDQFLLYAFDGQPASFEHAGDEVLRRARLLPALTRRVHDGCSLTYPQWVRGDVRSEQLVWHRADVDWRACLDAVAGLARDQLDLRRAGWRLHVFTGVTDVPRCAGSATVAVLQIGHTLADGQRSSALAAALFGRDAAVGDVVGAASDCLLTRSVAAARAHQALERDTAAGLVPPSAPRRPVLSINSTPGEEHTLRTLVRRRSHIAGPTVTVGVLAAISTALAGYLRARGEDPSSLGAEVPMAKAAARQANNHFRNVGVGLHPDATTGERIRRIGAELDERRRRGDHPALAAADRAAAAVPAPLVRWGVRHFDVGARSSVVTGNTVVSSVNRGPADISFGGRPVMLTAGYPALSPMMSLTHGAYGIGDTIAVSVHAATSAVDVDEYVGRLDAALGSRW